MKEAEKKIGAEREKLVQEVKAGVATVVTLAVEKTVGDVFDEGAQARMTEEALRVVRPSALREVLVEKPNVTWKDVGGLNQKAGDITNQISRCCDHLERVDFPMQAQAEYHRTLFLKLDHDSAFRFFAHVNFLCTNIIITHNTLFTNTANP